MPGRSLVADDSDSRRIQANASRPRAEGRFRPLGIPDHLARREVAAEQRLAGPLDEVGLARFQHQGVPGRRIGDGLVAQQTVLVEREAIIPGLAPVDREAVRLTEQPHPLNAQPIVARRQGKGGVGADVERLADRLVARLGEHHRRQGGPGRGQHHAAEPPVAVESPAEDAPPSGAAVAATTSAPARRAFFRLRT